MNDNDKSKTELVMENVHLRRKLAEAEARAERMEKRYKGQLAHNEGLEVSIRARKEQIKELKAEREELLKSNPSEAERRILDMWPRFEDGEPVLPLSEIYSERYGEDHEVDGITFVHSAVRLDNRSCNQIGYYQFGERVKRPHRPAPEVLDADGVPIEVGDTVWYVNTGDKFTVKEVSDRGLISFEETGGAFPAPNMLTHREPDSWERLFEDAEKTYCDYFGFGGKLCSGCPAEHSEIDCSSVRMFDLLRRAKALAGGVE